MPRCRLNGETGVNALKRDNRAVDRFDTLLRFVRGIDCCSASFSSRRRRLRSRFPTPTRQSSKRRKKRCSSRCCATRPISTSPFLMPMFRRGWGITRRRYQRSSECCCSTPICRGCSSNSARYTFAWGRSTSRATTSKGPPPTIHRLRSARVSLSIWRKSKRRSRAITFPDTSSWAANTKPTPMLPQARH